MLKFIKFIWTFTIHRTTFFQIQLFEERKVLVKTQKFRDYLLELTF